MTVTRMARIARWILLGALAAAGLRCAPNPPHAENRYADGLMRQLADFQDQRRSDSLMPYLRHGNPAVRAYAAQAFGSVQDSGALPALLPLLEDAHAEVAAAAAYALGQLGKPAALHPLMAAASSQTLPDEARDAVLEAIGKCANDTAAAFLAHYPIQPAGVAAGLFRAVIRGQGQPAVADRLLRILHDTLGVRTRMLAATALARWPKAHPLPPHHFPVLSKLLQNDPQPFVRMHCATALARVPGMEGVFRQVLAHETHPLVRVNLLRALARGEASEESVSAALAATADIYPQVAQTAAESAAGLFARGPSPEMAQRLEAAMANPALPWAVRAPLAGALVGYRADYSALVLEALRNAAGPYEQSAWLQALAQAPANYRYIKERLQTNDVPAVRSAALEALVAIRNHPGFEALRGQKDGLDAEFDDMMVNALQSADIGLIYHASQELLAHPERYPAASDTAMLARVLRGLRLPEDVEAHQALGAVLAKLRGEAYEAPPASTEHPIDWDVVARTPQWQQVLVQTSKGRIVWELLVDEAPGTVATVKALVESGAYNGRAFHRVVPNFVAQGGCPRGDGFGGLPYTIRSEFAPLYYGEGYVGMASAGKDTESCQWFITHSPTPHLDGRYSIFARVVEGMQVVNQLSVGDRIEYMVVVGSE